ncbi:hypothetical protein [Microbacterium sp. JZ101]
MITRSDSREPAKAIYVPGEQTSRPRLAGYIVSLGVLSTAGFAWLFLVIVAATSSWGHAWSVVSTVARGFITPSLVALALAGPAIITLRLRFEGQLRRGLIDQHALDERRRCDSLTTALAIAAVALATAGQLGAYTRLSTVGGGVVMLVLAALAVVFAVGIGIPFVANAREQVENLRTQYRARRQVLEELDARELPTRRRALFILASWGSLLLLGVPAAFSIWLSLGDASASWTTTVIGTVVVLSLVSAYGIAWSSSALGPSRVDRVSRVAGKIFAGGGWFPLAVFEGWFWLSTGDRGWAVYSIAFALIGAVSVWLARSSARSPWTVRAAVAALLEPGLRSRADSLHDRICALQNDIARVDLERESRLPLLVARILPLFPRKMRDALSHAVTSVLA